MKKIKVCYVISSLCNQGPTNVLYNIIRYIDYVRFEVSVITMIEEQKNSRMEDFKALPIRIIQMSPNKTQNPISMYMTLRKTVEEVNPDILHTHCPRSMFLVPLLPKKYKKVETVHIFPGIQQMVLYGKLKGTIVIWLNHFFTKRMDLPIACSESVAQSYLDEQHFSMGAIPNGCSLPVWERDETEKQKLRHQFGMRDDIKYFIFIGRFSQEKNPDLLVKAFEEIEDQSLGIILLGDGVMYEDLKKHESNRILLPGFKSNVYDYVKAADYYISASDIEGLPNTLLESMTVGLPCVLSDIPSHREVMAKATQPIGYLFKGHDLSSLKLCINKVKELDVPTISIYIQQLFRKYYTAKMMSEKYQEEYLKLMK